MDPRYYAQGSSSQYSPQYQDGAGSSQQLVPAEAQAVTHYIRALYQNPSHQVAPPTQAPAFFAKAQKDIMDAKHKLEQMLLINQQQAEIAAATQTIPAPSSHTQHSMDHGVQYQPAYHQANYQAMNNMQYQQPAWTNTVGGGWANHQQMYVQPAPHAYTAHFSPEIEIVDMPSVQNHGTTQRSNVQQSSIPRQQAGSAAQSMESRQPQQRAIVVPPAPSGHSRTDPQQQVVSGHQHAGALAAQTQQLRHPQPQHHPRRNTLQPAQSTSQSNPPQHNPPPDQLAAAQKQLLLLRHLEQQHQRPQTELSTSSVSNRQLSAQQQHSQQQALQQQLAQPQPVVIPLPAAEVPANTQPVGPSLTETVRSPKPDVAPPASPIHTTPRVSLPPKEPETPNGTVPTSTPGSRSPTKITRAGRGFALQDLRSERRHSSRRSLSQSTLSNPPARGSRETNPEKDATITSIDDTNQVVVSNHNTAPSNVGNRMELDGPAGSTAPVPLRSDNTGEENLQPPSDGIVVSHASTSTAIAGPTLASEARSPPAAASAAELSLSGPAQIVTTSASDASVPALNTPSTSTISVPPAMQAVSIDSQVHVSATQGVSSESQTTTSGQPRKASSTAPTGTTRATPMKVMLEFLHENGIDCVEIVRRAAQAAEAPVDLSLLQRPSPGMGGGGTPVIPLFAPNQPLEVWTHALRVPKALGDLIVKYIWEISWEKANQAGLKVPREAAKGTARATGSNGAAQGNGIQQSGSAVGTGVAGVPSKSTAPPGEPGTSSTLQPAAPLLSQPSQSIQQVQSIQDKPAQRVQPVQSVQPPQPVQLAQARQAHSRSQTHTPVPNISGRHSQTPRLDSTHLPASRGASSEHAPLSAPAHQPVPFQHHPPQGYYNMPPVQGYPPQGFNPTPAQLHSYAPYSTVQPPPLQHPSQYYSQGPVHPYVPPHLQEHVQHRAPKAVPTQPAAPERTKEPNVPVGSAKAGNTAALDFIRSLGLTPELEELAGKGKGKSSGSEAGSETNKAKGKGKAKAGVVNTAAQSSVTQLGTPVDKGETTIQPLAETGNSAVTDVVKPVVANQVDQASKIAPASEIPQAPAKVPVPSPLLAPSIAVLQEPQTPSTPASSFSAQLPEPAPPAPISPLALAPVPTALPEIIPTPVSLPAPVLAEVSVPGLAPPSPPASSPISAPVSAPVPVTLMPAPSPGPSAGSPQAIGPTLEIVAPSPVRGFTPAGIMGYSSILISPTTSPAAPLPVASSSTLPPAAQDHHSEYGPLKRKRKVTDPPSNASASTSAASDPTMTWAAMYAQAANAMHSAPVVKRPRTTDPSTSAARSVPRKQSENVASGSRLPANSSKYMPLFRPATPSIDAEDSPKWPGRTGKRRMIMEVVLPLRKVKPKAADMTLNAEDDEDEDDPIESEEVEEDRTEKEQDLKLLRRRLREHTCKWRGCVGPAVLSSAELLGVHLNKKHFYRRSSTGSFVCRWGLCKTSFRRAKDLWEHISDEHIVHPLHCPYQECDRTVADRYQLLVHVKRAHRGKSDSELRLLARPEECTPDQEVIRPSAFPAGVPYFRIMGMMLRYNVQPARISALRHARIGPVILRNISATASYASPTRTVTPHMSQEPGTSAGANAMPVFESPVPARTFVRLGTLPPDVLGEELQRETAVASTSKLNISPTRSHITVHSDDETPEREIRTPSKGFSRARGGGFLRGRGMGSRGRPHTSQASVSSRGSGKGPRLQMVVELPSPASRKRGRG
ncbi:hypothetical protein BDV93DRAFT_519695 [Ceratobasidium sp. AG-I]|nr:hypothetical protein BDV93DRAFT_519695 [Ceratobasidium sp. AG-I]